MRALDRKQYGRHTSSDRSPRRSWHKQVNYHGFGSNKLKRRGRPYSGVHDLFLNVEDRKAMAKALLGHVGHDLDLRMVSELRRMRDRVRELEGEVARLEAANSALASGLLVDDDMLTLSVPDRVVEHALA